MGEQYMDLTDGKRNGLCDGSDRTPWKCLILIASGGNLTTNGEIVRKIINTSFLSISVRHKPFS